MKKTGQLFTALCAWVFIVYMFVAGVSKFASLSTFRDSLDTWVLLPEMTKAPITIVVPLVETGFAVLWMFGKSRNAYIFLGTMLIVFTSVYIAHVIFVEPPDCNCTVKLAAFDLWQNSAVGVLVRNTMLFLLWGCGLVYVWQVVGKPGKEAE